MVAGIITGVWGFEPTSNREGREGLLAAPTFGLRSAVLFLQAVRTFPHGAKNCCCAGLITPLFYTLVMNYDMACSAVPHTIRQVLPPAYGVRTDCAIIPSLVSKQTL